MKFSSKTNYQGFSKDIKKEFPYNVRNWVPNIKIDIESNNYFRVMSYNILCESLFTTSTNMQESELENYPYLKWEKRKKNILKEIQTIKPDILCLQELERDEYLINELGLMNFDVLFKR